jgi:hypothetical protein
VGLAVLDGGQAVEVPLNALRELVAIRSHHLELGLPASPVAARPRIAAEHGRDPGPLGDHESGHGASEQCSEHQAHGIILATPDFEPSIGLIPSCPPSDTARVAGMTTSSAFLVPWAMIWVVLLRALLVEADLLPRTCRRCALPLERHHVGEDICSCDVVSSPR